MAAGATDLHWPFRARQPAQQPSADFSWVPLLPLLTRLSLQQRMGVFVLAALGTVFLIVGYLGMRSLQDSVNRTTEERLQTTKIMASRADAFLSHGLYDLGSLLPAAREAFLRGDSTAAEEAIRLEFAQLRFFFRIIYIVDDEGRLWAAYRASPATELPMPQADPQIWVSLGSTKPRVSDMTRSPRGEPLIEFMWPLLDEQGAFFGLLVGEMSLPHPNLNVLSTLLQLGATGHLHIVDGNGVVMAGSEHPDELYTDVEHPSFYKPLIRSRVPTVGPARVEDKAGDIRHIMAFAPLASAQWGVGLGQTEAETLAPTQELMGRLAVLGILALVAVSILAWLGTQTVVRPIQVLTRATERIGAGDLDSPVSVPYQDELGVLAESFDRMRARLKAYQDQIEGWNRELENRVRERTRELALRNEYLSALNAVATGASQRARVEDSLAATVARVVQVLGVDSGWVYLRQEEEDRLRLAAHHNMSLELLRQELDFQPDHLCRQVADTRQISVQRNVGTCTCVSSAAVNGQNIACCICVPLRSNERAVGVMCLAAQEDRQLSPEEVQLLEAIGGQVGVAVDNARLFRELAKVEAAREMDRLKAEFISGISHELRTPLGFIKGYTTTLLRQDVEWENGTRQEFLQIIQEEADRLQELIDNLLDASRLHAGGLKMEMGPVRAEEVIARVAKRASSTTQRHQVSVKVPQQCPVVEADSRRLEQVLHNLLSNAIKYSPDGGPITVEASVGNEELVVSVMDQGIGVPESESERVFDAFYRSDEVVAKSIGGGGLGLAICRGIVESHGGRIWVEHLSPRGSAFRFTLPLATSPAESDQGVGEKSVELALGPRLETRS